MPAKYRIRRYEKYTYDLWGNAKDGYEVNDVYKQGTVDIKCHAVTHNVDTPQEFTTYDPTDLQLTRAVGGRGLEWDGESDYTLYANSKSNGSPQGELRFLHFVE